MKRFKLYCTRFIQEEDGAELIEVAIAIAIVAVLAAAILGIVTVLQGKIGDARTLIDDINVGEYQSNNTTGSGTVNNGVGD